MTKKSEKIFQLFLIFLNIWIRAEKLDFWKSISKVDAQGCLAVHRHKNKYGQIKKQN